MHHAVVLALLLTSFFLGGCHGDDLRPGLDPEVIAQAEWAEPLLVVDMPPNAYLERARGRLRLVEPLSVRIGGVPAEVERADGDGLEVRLTSSLSVGVYTLFVESGGAHYETSEALTVLAEGPVDAGSDADAAVDSAVGDAAPDTATGDVCGDRTLGPSETCDDGNLVDGDGCSSSCALETMRDACPGNPVALSLGGAQLYRGTIADASDTAMCRGGIGSGPDRVIEIDPDFTGWLNIQLTPIDDFDAALMTRSECPGTSEYFCADSMPSGGREIIDGTVDATRRYMIIASSSGPGEVGEYVIRLEGRTSP